MIKIIIALLVSTLAFAGPYDEAEKRAKEHLDVEYVKLEKESEKSYFFLTNLEFTDDESADEFPCYRGVVVDKETLQVVDPLLDLEIVISFPYSDTRVDGFIVVNCAD